jgi:hypothetical protein
MVWRSQRWFHRSRTNGDPTMRAIQRAFDLRHSPTHVQRRQTTMAASTQGLLSLPTELLAHTCSYLSPKDVVSFALSSRACSIGAADILNGLQNTFLDYKTLDDSSPVELLDRLRIILKDDFRAGCVRHLQIGDVKSSWHDWTLQENDQSQLSEDPNDVSVSELNLEPQTSQTEGTEWQTYYTHDELEEYRRLLRAYIFRNFTANTLSNEHIIMLRHGQDDVLKLLLIALCPRLETLTFHAFRPSKQDRPRLCPHPLFYSFLAHDQDIRQVFDPKTRWHARTSPKENPWPPGFRSLRKVSVSAPLPGGRPSEPFYARPANVAGLFLLPHIETLELYHLRHRGGWDEWIPIRIGCSSVRNLRFENCQMKTTTLLRFVTASRALRQLNIKRCGRNLGFISRWVGDWYVDSLGK